MTNWKEYKLGELIETVSKTFKFSDKKVVFLNTSDTLEGKVINHNLFEPKKLPGQAKKTIQPNDILYSEIRPANKRYAFVDFDSSNYVVSTKLMVLRVLDKEIISPKYLYYFLTSDEIVSYLQMLAESRSGTFPQIRFEEVSLLDIKLPPLNVQNEIVELVASLDDKIELNNKINQELENLAQTLFKQWFIDFEFPNENGEPYKSSGGEMVESELGEIPKGWEVGSIYDVSDVIYGAPFKSKLFNQENKGLPLIRIRDLKTFQPQNWTEEIHPKGTKIIAGDLVVGMDAEFRPHFWLGQPAWLNQRLCHFRPKKGFSKLFVREIIRPQLAFHENSSVGTTVIHLGKGDIDTFKSLIPSKKVLLAFEELSNSLFDSIINTSKENQELTLLRDTLLPKLISGELKVEEPMAEKA